MFFGVLTELFTPASLTTSKNVCRFTTLERVPNTPGPGYLVIWLLPGEPRTSQPVSRLSAGSRG